MISFFFCWTGASFNIKMSSYQYKKSHLRNRTILISSNLYNGNCYTGKITFWPLSPLGWKGIVIAVWAGGWVGSCHTFGTNIFVTARQIFSVWSSVELSRPVVVYCHSHLPICPYGLAHRPKTCQIRQHLSNQARLCGTHISETAKWIYTIWNSMELSRLVVLQHHGHLTLTLSFQGQILKMLYLRNGRAD